MNGITVLRHVPHETLGTFRTCSATPGWTGATSICSTPCPSGSTSPAQAGLVVLGGPMNVDEIDAYPWLVDEVRWIRQAVEAELPVLGICLGAQLLAKALGAKVTANPVKEIGWYELELTAAAADDPLFGGCGPRHLVFQSHGDTFALPDGAVHLARGELCENQAFRFGRSAWGLAVSHRDDRGSGPRVARRAGHPASVRGVGLHRPGRHPRRNARGAAEDARPGRSRAAAFRGALRPEVGRSRMVRGWHVPEPPAKGVARRQQATRHEIRLFRHAFALATEATTPFAARSRTCHPASRRHVSAHGAGTQKCHALRRRLRVVPPRQLVEEHGAGAEGLDRDVVDPDFAQAGQGERDGHRAGLRGDPVERERIPSRSCRRSVRPRRGR